MRLLTILLLCACAFGCDNKCPQCHEQLKHGTYHIHGKNGISYAAVDTNEIKVTITTSGGALREDGTFTPHFIGELLDSVEKREHGRFYEALVYGGEARSFAKCGDTLWGNINGKWEPPAIYPHDWCWGDTIRHEEELNIYQFLPHGFRVKCPAICRVCNADTLAVWSYAEDQQRKKAAKTLTEYERLKARKK